MEELPVRIEGFDISTIGGEHTVASMVVFEGGATKKSDYRRFKVRGDLREDGVGNGGPDDFASMEEVLCAADGALPRTGRPLARTTANATPASPRSPR